MSADALRDRIATIAYEAFGPFPVQTVEEDLTAIERGIHEAGMAREGWRARAAKAEGRLREIDKCRATLRQIDEQRMLLNGEPDGEPASRPPLDPAHVEALRGMLADERDDLIHIELAVSEGRKAQFTLDKVRTRIAALTAVLGGVP